MVVYNCVPDRVFLNDELQVGRKKRFPAAPDTKSSMWLSLKRMVT